MEWALAYSHQKKQTHLTHIRNPPITQMPGPQTYFIELGQANFLLLTKRKRTVTCIAVNNAELQVLSS